MVTKVAVGCGGCGQQGRIDLERVSDRLKCKCGSSEVDLLERRRDTRARFITASLPKRATHPTYDWDPDPVGDAWRASTPNGDYLIVEPDLTTGFYGVVEDERGNVLHHQVMSTDNLDEAKGHMEVAYAEEFLAGRNERQTEQAVVGSKSAAGRISVRPGTYRREEGWFVSGTDPRGRQVKVFVRNEDTARSLKDAIKAEDEEEFRRLLLSESKTSSNTADKVCPTCGGTGNLPEGGSYEGTEKCPECGGSGRVTAARRDTRTSTLRQNIIEDIRATNPNASMGKVSSLARRVEQTYLRQAR